MNEKEKRKEIIKKWEASGFLEGLNDDFKENIAKLYENQAKYLINEVSSGETNEFPSVLPIAIRVASKMMDTPDIKLMDDENKEPERRFVVHTSKEVMDKIDHEIISDLIEKYKDENNDKTEGKDSI